MEIKNICISYDIDRSCPPKRASVTHVNDVNTRIIELTLRQGDDKLDLDSGCTANVSIVERVTKKLITSGVACEISESGTILIPIDNLHFRDKMDINIEVSVNDSSDEQVLTLPYPIWVRVNPSILDEAEVTDKSLGTVPELLEEAKELVEGYHYELTEDDVERIAGEVDVSGKADKATTLAGYGITDAYKKIEINQMFNQVDADLQGKADAIDTYTKTQTDTLLNAKESTANKVTAVNSSASDIQYPSAKAVYQIVSTVANNGEVKTNKVTTISSSSTNTQYPSAKAVYTYVTNAIDTAIGGVENGSY